MTEGTVTQAIRALLGEGLTSGEIIARGYRPGTVYKVLRSARLAVALLFVWMAWAKLFTVSVLASPGTPSNSTWPPVNNPTSRRKTIFS